MTHVDTPDSLEARARRRVGMKIGFMVHALVFLLVNLGLYALNTAIGGHRWSVFPFMGWGLGLTVHGIVTLVALGGEGWRQRMVRSEIERLGGR